MPGEGSGDKKKRRAEGAGLEVLWRGRARRCMRVRRTPSGRGTALAGPWGRGAASASGGVTSAPRPICPPSPPPQVPASAQAVESKVRGGQRETRRRRERKERAPKRSIALRGGPKVSGGPAQAPGRCSFSFFFFAVVPAAHCSPLHHVNEGGVSAGPAAVALKGPRRRRPEAAKRRVQVLRARRARQSAAKRSKAVAKSGVRGAALEGRREGVKCRVRAGQ